MADKLIPTNIKRVRLNLAVEPAQKIRTVWAEVHARAAGLIVLLRVVDREGQRTDEVILASPSSVLSQKDCVMNATYCELEVVK